MKKLEIVFYDIIKGYSRLVDDTVVYESEEQKNRIFLASKCP